LNPVNFTKFKKNCPHITHMPVKGIHSYYFVFANKFMWKFVNYIKNKLTRIVNRKLFCELTVQVTRPHSFEVSPKRNT